MKPVLVGVALLVLLLFFLRWERNEMYRHATESIHNTSDNISKILQGVIQSQYKCGRAKDLDAVLENVMTFSEIKYVLLTQNGKPILETGGKNLFPKVNAPSGFNLIDGKFYYWKKINQSNIMEHCELSPKKCRSGNACSDDVFLGIILEDQDYFAHITQCNIKLIVTLIIGLSAILILIAVWIHLIRNNELKLELVTVRKKNEYLSELSFASSGLAHETKNPLGIVRGLAQKITLMDDVNFEQIKRLAGKIVDEVDVTTERLNDFMNYADIRELKMTPLRLKEVINEISELMSYDFEKAGVRLESKLDDVMVSADREAVIQIVVNLLQNSIQACAARNTISISLLNKGEWAELTVADNGSGIDPNIISDIFKPYVRGNKKGHGIGLAIVKKLLDASDWEIKTVSQSDKGTSMIISGIRIV